MDQNCKLWVCPVSAETFNFERMFKDSLFFMRHCLWSKFQQTRAIFRGTMASEIPKKGPFHGCWLPQKHLKIYNLTTTNATLMKLNTIFYLRETFNLAKDWGVTHRA